MRRPISAFAFSCMILSATSLLAQDIELQSEDAVVDVDERGVDVDVQRESNRRRAASGMNAQIAQWLTIDQRSIVDLAEFGLQRTKTPEVRQLAESIIEDHRALARQLAGFQRATGGTTAEVRRAPLREDSREDARERLRDNRRDRDGVRRPVENLVDRVEDGLERLGDRAERAVENVDDAFDDDSERDVLVDRSSRGPTSAWVQIHREIVERLSEMSKADLDKRSGYEFDASLVGMFVASHLQQEATMKVLAQRATGNLKQNLQRAVTTLRQHRERAEQVMQNAKR